MAKGDNCRDEFDGVRDLARRGLLVAYLETAGDAERRRVRIEAHEILHPLVFGRFTRKIELNRGHRWCAISVAHLEHACLDRFHDDVDAVLDDLFRNARVPIHNLEGWVSKRMKVATIEGYRRRRGRRGALQRPRIPLWLEARLGEDPWLMALAVELLEFVGNDVAMVPGTWPVNRWSERRALAVGGDVAGHHDVSRDVETVLAAMRSRPDWYESYVERPLESKQAPVLVVPPAAESAKDVLMRVDTTDPLLELAALAVEAIERRLAEGEDPRAVVLDVVHKAFDFPGPMDSAAEERFRNCLADPAEIERLTDAVLRVIAGHD